MNVRESSRQKTNEIISYVLERIENEEWEDGFRLPTEKLLTEQFQAARNTVRKAMAQLEADGMIKRHVGRGTFVQRNNMEDPPTGAGLNIVKFGDASPAEINEIRVILEPAAADQIVSRATRSEIEYARLCLANTYKAKNTEEYEHWDSELHSTIIKAAKNNLLTCLYQEIRFIRQQSEWHEIKRRSLNNARRKNYDEDHKKIVDALVKRDAKGLCSAMKQHLQSVSENMLSSADG